MSGGILRELEGSELPPEASPAGIKTGILGPIQWRICLISRRLSSQEIEAKSNTVRSNVIGTYCTLSCKHHDREGEMG